MPVRPSGLLSVLLAILVFAAPSFAQSGEGDPEPESESESDPYDYFDLGPEFAKRSASLDIFVFDQQDEGANPVRDENLTYTSQRLQVGYKPSEQWSFNGSLTVAQLDGGGFVAEAVENVGNALSTRSSESESRTPITATLGAEWTPEESKWRFGPSLYYFTQNDYQSRGVDLFAAYDFNDGNTIPSIALSMRNDTKELLWWNDMNPGEAGRKSYGITLGLTQIITPRLVMTGSFQYTHMRGFLSEPRNPYALYQDEDDDEDEPFLFADERLPDRRDRYQFNLRARYSLKEDWSIGLDTSYYTDTWDLTHTAFEGSLAGRLSEAMTFRTYLRYASQSATEYFHKKPLTESTFQTQDSDLGTFDSIGGGVGFEYAHTKPWSGMWLSYRLTAFGHSRDDDLSGIGVLLSVAAKF